MDKIFQGDVLTQLKRIKAGSVNTCVTSPPYFGLRDYGVKGQIGLEETPEAFVQKLVEVFREVRRVLRDDGTVWLNLGDSYNSGASGGLGGTTLQGGMKTHVERRKATYVGDPGLKHKDLIGIPWRVAFALQADGWYLRQDIIWHKPNPMPESVTDRCTKAHEYVFLLSKSSRYYFDADAIKEPATWRNTTEMGRPFGWASEGRHTAISHQISGRHRKSQSKGSFLGKTGDRAFRKTGATRNKRSVWTVSTKPYKDAHFATFPPDLIEPCVLAGSPEGGLVLDPFMGSGTTAAVAKKLDRHYVGTELNVEYIKLAEQRIAAVQRPQPRLWAAE